MCVLIFLRFDLCFWKLLTVANSNDFEELVVIFADSDFCGAPFQIILPVGFLFPFIHLLF